MSLQCTIASKDIPKLLAGPISAARFPTTALCRLSPLKATRDTLGGPWLLNDGAWPGTEGGLADSLSQSPWRCDASADAPDGLFPGTSQRLAALCQYRRAAHKRGVIG